MDPHDSVPESTIAAGGAPARLVPDPTEASGAAYTGREQDGP
jgi:hypothetical protein